MNFTILAMGYLAIISWQLPSIWKRGQKREIILYLTLILLDIVLSIFLVLHYNLPPLSDSVIYLFEPLKDFVYDTLK